MGFADMYGQTWPGSGIQFRARNANNGRLLADRVGIAATHVGRAIGLLTRSGLQQGEALWIVPSRGVHTWFMRFAIDVIAIDDAGRVIDTVRNMRPWRMRLPRPGSASVLELPAGTLDASATRLGDQVVFEIERAELSEAA
jgi:uncharacterized membrane protein (UPF0127 family)